MEQAKTLKLPLSDWFAVLILLDWAIELFFLTRGDGGSPVFGDSTLQFLRGVPRDLGRLYDEKSECSPGCNEDPKSFSLTAFSSLELAETFSLISLFFSFGVKYPTPAQFWMPRPYRSWQQTFLGNLFCLRFPRWDRNGPPSRLLHQGCKIAFFFSAVFPEDETLKAPNFEVCFFPSSPFPPPPPPPPPPPLVCSHGSLFFCVSSLPTPFPQCV